MCFCASVDVKAVLPLVILVLFSMGILCLDLVKLRKARLVWTVSACLSAWAASWPLLGLSGSALGGLVSADAYSFIFYTIILSGTLLTFLLNDKQFEAQRVRDSIDIDILILLAAAGAMVMVSAANLIVLFLGFEMLSVSVYVLAGLARKEKASAESAMKYFILGAFSSAFLLYGMTLVYGATGSMNLGEISTHLDPHNLMLVIGIGLIIFGFGFKVSLVPFHFWTPDVYQGAPTAITGFMATVVKAAAFGAFLRVVATSFASIPEVWTAIIWIIAVLTMCFGNLVALRQKSIKRMLAYSSIAHAGYALIGLLAQGSGGVEATIYYLIAYSFMTIGAFGVLLFVTAGSDAQYQADDISSFSGLGFTHPCLGLMMTVFLLSLAGIPPLAGFVGKFYLFNAAVQGGFVGLAIIAALNSVVSLYYYLGIIVKMYFVKEREVAWSPQAEVPFAQNLALNISCVLIILLGVFSDTPYLIIQAAARSLSF